MAMDFGYEGEESNDTLDPEKDNEQNKEEVTNLETGNKDTEGKDDINDSNKIEKNNVSLENNGKVSLEKGTTFEFENNTYTVDESGNIIDKDGNIFKEAKDVNEWLKNIENVVENENEISINTIKEYLGVDITDENDKPVEFENTAEGIKSYIDAVMEATREENYQTAINTLYQKYPILNDVLNYYIANGNSLEGFGEIPDRSNITINDTDEAQQEAIIRQAWKEQGRKGDINGYIQYLKSSGTLLATAKEELEGLQESDRQYRENLEKEAEEKENERIEKLEKYWNGVHDVIKSRNIAGYQIPESIIINKNGQKISVTPEDFFNYVYRVDKDGKSAYERDLAKETLEDRRNDEILRAYLKFVGGDYSNLVDMAINKEKVNKLKLRAKERNTSSIRIIKSNNTEKKDKIDFGYN